MERLAVLGSPIAHSRSPLIHRAAYAELGLDWHYGRVRCGESALAAFLAGRDASWRGLSLTMPLKDEARRLAASLDPVAAESGVVNTLRRRDDGAWDGFNTDVGGLAAAIGAAGFSAERTLVLGSGATAISALLAARSLGATTITIAARNAHASRAIVDRFGEGREPGSGIAPEVRSVGLAELTNGRADAGASAAHGAGGGAPTLVISTLPGPAARDVALPESLMAVPLFDVAYDPWPSPLATRWSAAGGSASSGLGMLVEQAILQIRIFLSGSGDVPLPSEDRVREAVDRAIAASGVGG
ncbi:shikimate dehydrogenase family protein [Leucobacter edaphi]|uniref:shikimate dehydrogenase family protein n=1 Tax=Leucobacter edaphi TaxID=2796472 RepID=UPI0034E1ECA2